MMPFKWRQGKWPCDLDFDAYTKNSCLDIVADRSIVFHKLNLLAVKLKDFSQRHFFKFDIWENIFYKFYQILSLSWQDMIDSHIMSRRVIHDSPLWLQANAALKQICTIKVPHYT